MSKLCLGCMEQFGDEYDVCPNCGYIEGTKADEATHMNPGSMLYGRYIIGKVLGFGGFGVTYIGWDTKLEQKVAIKEYLPSEFSTRMPGEATVTVFGGEKNEQFLDGLDKFVDEAKRLANFQNEAGIVKVFDSFKENNTAYIIMEYLEGETLTSYIEREGNIPEEEAIKMLTPVMVSLQTVHEKGILHRDIAPDNIFILKNGDVKLIDFGASRYATTSHSRSLTVIIKPGYSPEEQYRSRGDQGPHTDVYALAAVMYKMITGITPPDALERRALIETKHKDMLKDIHKTVKNISVNTENAILNAMNVQIEDRTPDVISFMGELNSPTPIKRRYGKIKKIDVHAWPMWLKVALPVCLVAFMAMGALLLTGLIKFPSLFSDEVVVPDGVMVVPDVEGMYKDDALKQIEDLNLIPVPEGNIESKYIEAGKIVLQTPTGGSYLSENEKVVLTVSSGSGVIQAENGISTVPYVVWGTKKEAIEKMRQAGLAEPIIETRSDDNVPAGQVISQSVNSGEKLAEGSQITIVVSTGPAEFKMPNVVGKADSNAQKTLSDKGLIVSVEYAKDDSVSVGCVISQSIKSGSSVKAGARVIITVSSGKTIVSVPNVVGKTQSAAESALSDKGFKVSVLENYDSNIEKGKVINQNPSAGSNQIKGSTITIYVSKGKQPITVSFNANGGSVSESSKTVYLSSTYGTLPTPKRSYSTFAGWYTAEIGGSRITDSTTVSNSSNHTLYAHWNENGVSDWVLASSMPSGARIIEEKWEYTLTKTSADTSISGWIRGSSGWGNAQNLTNQYAEFNLATTDGHACQFQTSHELYKKYNNSIITNGTFGNKRIRNVNNTIDSYIYWHWTPKETGYYGTIQHYPGKASNNDQSYDYFSAYHSQTPFQWDRKGNSSGLDMYIADKGSSYGSKYWYQSIVYNQTYIQETLVYTYTKNETSNTQVSNGQNINGATVSNVKKYVKYQTE